MQAEGGVFEVITEPNEPGQGCARRWRVSTPLVSAQVENVPQNTVAPQGEDLENLYKILELLDDSDDVNEVYHNAELPEEEEEE